MFKIFLCLTALVSIQNEVWGQPVTQPLASTASPDSSLEDSCEYLDNGCPADFDIHLLLPHETSCRKFYFCVRGERVLRSCAIGLVFNPDIENCDHAGSINRTCEEEDSSSEEDSISEEYVEPEEIELLPNGCPVNYTISMYLPHEYYCNVYYQCVFGQKVNQRCPDGTHYNQEVQNCDHIVTANCQLPGGNFIETTTTTAAPTTPSFVLQPNGCPVDQSIHWLVAHEDCTKFYFCVWGGLVESNCPDGLYFNPVAQYCDNPALAGCANDPCKKKPCSNSNSSTESTTISTTKFTTPQATDGSTSFTTSPTEFTSPTTIINTSDPTTDITTEATSSSSTIGITNPTTEIPTEATVSSTIIDSSTSNITTEPSTTPTTIETSDPTTDIATEADSSSSTIGITDPTTEIPTEATVSSTIIDSSTSNITTEPSTTPTTIETSDPTTDIATEATSSSSTIGITDPTTEIPTEATVSSTIIDSSTSNITTEPSTTPTIIETSDPTTDIATEATSSSSTIGITDPTTEIPTEATVSSTIIDSSTSNITTEPSTTPTIIETSDPTTDIATEATSSSSSIGITDPTTEIPTEATVSSTIIDSSTSNITTEPSTTPTTIETSDPTTDIATEATSSSSTIGITDPTMEIPTEATTSSTIIDSSTTDITIEFPSVSTTTMYPGSPNTTTSSSSTEFTTITIPTISKSTAVPSTTTVASTSSSSSTTEDSCEYLDNGCPADFDMHFLLPHETSCRKFYFCVRGEKVLRKCASGLVFNPDIGNCVHAGSIDRTCEIEDSSEEENISEEYIEPEELELLPNGCPVNYTISMYLPHEYYCNVYYQCIYGQKIERYCPNTTHFNPISQNCDHIFNANCSLPGGDYVTSTTTQAPTEASTKPIDLLPNGCPKNGSINWMVAHEECTKYYACVWGSLLEMDCPDGTHFNAVEQYCDNPATAGCKICKKPCCSGNNGDNNCDGNGTTDNDNDEEISNEDDYTTDDYEDNNDEENDEENDNVDDENDNDENINNSYESAEADCNGAENEYECIEEKRCEEECNTLPRAHQDCDKYWICYGKKPVLVTCVEGLHFNPSTSTCDYPCYAGCVRENVQATSSNDGLKLFLPWNEIDEEMRSILKRKSYFH